MPKVDSLRTLLVIQLRDLYDAEKRLTKAIPKLIKASSSEELSSALENHLRETENQVTRLERVFDEIGEPARGKECAGIRGIIEEGDEHVNEDFTDDLLRDATIIGAAQRAEHYEIAAYGTAMAHAKLLGLDRALELLGETLEEEKAADEKLTEIAEQMVNPDAASAVSDEEEEEGELAGVGAGFRSNPASRRATPGTNRGSSGGNRRPNSRGSNRSGGARGRR